ncbi:BON domain-containing protein [Aromatoleum diolicum]|uniref:BON domain-containing protein n=1 Tax=Aromatoleum diolicum TaxID=75796 RepID=A0ABX1QEX7_9RHOO|nr:BON domain-containing protein [Aromatoleum diolicum]NMG76530.1 BON domain-containing protein [Aromatoleum diolicum]
MIISRSIGRQTIARQTVASVLTTTAIAFSICTAAEAASLAAAAQATTPIISDERDRHVQREIKTALSADPGLRNSHIAVSAHSGLVTLAGVVTSDEQRGRAQRAAMAVRGVREVENILEVAEH